jgi:hypothetical protein
VLVLPFLAGCAFGTSFLVSFLGSSFGSSSSLDLSSSSSTILRDLAAVLLAGEVFLAAALREARIGGCSCFSSSSSLALSSFAFSASFFFFSAAVSFFEAAGFYLKLRLGPERY